MASGERDRVGNVRAWLRPVGRAAALAAFLAAAPVPALSAQLTLHPSQPSPNDLGAQDAVVDSFGATPNPLSITASGFGSGSGTVNSVTVNVRYKTSGTVGPTKPDTYRFSTTVNASTLSPDLVASSSTAQAAFVTASRTYTGLTWADVSTLQIVGALTAVAQPDGYSVDWDAAWIVVDYTAPSGQITLANGNDTGLGGAVCPGGAALALDAFTLQTNTGTDSVTGATVTLCSGATALALVEVTSDGGGSVFGSAASPASTSVPLTLSPTITATTTATQYKVRVTPRSHAAMTVGSYSITGRITALTSGFTPSLGDSGSGTVTIDNQPTSAPTAFGATPSAGQVSLAWANPSGFQDVLVLRKAGSAPTETPAEGQTYSQGSALGTAEVLYAGAGTSFLDANVAGGTTYHYAVFARDACSNWSPSATTSATAPIVPRTVLGSGVDPAGGTICPGGPATLVDELTFDVTAAADTVTDLAAALAGSAGAGSAILEVELRAADGSPLVPARRAAPAGDAASFAGANLPAPVGTTTYRLYVTPKGQGAFSGSPTLQARITSFSAANERSGSDAASAFTLDDTAPGGASWGTITPGSNQNALAWTNPAGDFAQVIVVRRAGAAPTGVPAEGATYLAGAPLGDGTVVYAGAAQAFTDSGAVNGTGYHYAIFARDACGNYSAAALTGPHVPANTLTVGNGTDPGSASLCPGAAATNVDAFTLQTNGGTADVTAVRVRLAAGTAPALALLEIVAAQGGTVHGSVGNPSGDLVYVPLVTAIAASTTSRAYYVRVTPRSQGTMLVGSYPLTATVVEVVSPDLESYQDSGSATLTVDNQPPAAGAWVSATPGNGQATLTWTNPPTDFAGAVVLRSAGGAVGETPGEGTSPAAGTPLGGSTVAYAASGASFVDSPLANGTGYHYRLFARDACGNYSPGTAVGPVAPGGSVAVSAPAQPAGASVAAGATSVVVGRLTLTPTGGPIPVTRVRVENTGNVVAGTDVQSVQLYEDTDGNGAFGAATDTLVGLMAWSASAGRYVASPSAYSLSAARGLFVVLNVGTGATAGRTFQLRVSPGDVAVASPHSVASFTAFAGNAFTITAPVLGEGSATAGTRQATAVIVNPSGPTVSGTFRVQARAWGPTGEGALVVKLATNGSTTTFPYTMARVAAYGTAANAGIFEYQVPAATKAANYSLRVQVDNGRGATYSKAVTVVALPSGAGDGNLLVRDNSSQLCSDCHALASHGSEASGSKYGAWSTTCRDCHTPHGTRNVELVRESVTPPAITGQQPARPVYFSKKTGYAAAGGAAARADASYANADGTGVCQACHTRTADVAGNPRYRSGGGADGHGANERCATCHGHGAGFSAAGKQCRDCHLTTTADVDSYAFGDGATARLDETEWLTFGHGSGTNYPSGNGAARLAQQGNPVGDAGCLYCHSSSTSHDDPQNFFRLANLSYGANGPCLVCHAKKLGGSPPPGFDPDGAGTAYASIVSSKRVDHDHAAGPGHASPDHAGGNYCWDCHDPHGDRSAGGNTLHYMLQRQLVEQSVAGGPGTSGWGRPVAFAAAYEFNPGVYAPGGDATKWEFQDYYLGGLCTKCHDPENVPAGTGVRYYAKNGSYTATPPHDGGGSLRNRCSDCHVHPIGCGGCHNAPPASSVHAKHNELAEPAVNYSATTAEATPTQYGVRCVKCHQGTHANQSTDPILGKSLANPYQVEVRFDATVDPKNPSPAGYTRSGTVTAYQGTNGEYWGWQPGTCASVYCHSNGAPVDAPLAYANLTWTAQGTWTCASCHGTQASSATMSSAHALHLSYSAYSCEKCHAAVVTSGTALSTAAGGGKVLHVNGLKDVRFDAYLDNSGGSYGADLTCSNTYCHSTGVDRNGADGYASGPSIAWTTTGASTCRACHGGDASVASNVIGTSSGSARHANHVNRAALIGTNIGCAACHSGTVSGNTTISSKANHVNRDPNVALATITSPGGASRTGGSYSAGSCATNWCHSDGREPSGSTTYAPVSWTTAWTAGAECKGCHGRGAALAGEPDYATGNSHAKHLPATAAAAAAECVKCHQTTTGDGLTILPTGKHLDGDRTVAMASGTWTAGTKTCSGVSCHGAGAPVWGGTVTCTGCHGGSETDPLGNGTPNGVAAEWTTKGHGSALGGSFSSTSQGCDYCHDLASAHTPPASTNPYRLRFSATDNSLCLQCHKTGDAGVTVGTNENSSKNVDETHFGAKHQAGEGGFFCWDCHDPHGTSNLRMVKTAVSRTSNAYGVPLTTGAVVFTDNTTAGPGLGRFVELTANPEKKGMCQACHSPSKGSDATTGSTKYWRWDGTDQAGGASAHNATSLCTACHQHNKKFGAAGGGDCKGCHGGPQGALRGVVADFSLQSHHAGNGGATMGGSLTNFDCVVCHAEGVVDAGPPRATNTSATYHMNGKIDLRNADSATVYPYDKSVMPAAAADWGSKDASWRTQTSTNLDPFCLSCHDANGASSSHALGDTGAAATNPFADGKVANDYDQLVRCNNGVGVGGKFTACAAPGAIVDIKTKISAPYARHAIRGQSTSIYSKYTGLGSGFQSMYEYGGFVSTGATDGTPLWNDTSVMGCADCHTVDGANGAGGNAHGSGSEYLLKDKAGGATEGSKTNAMYVCYRCHTEAKYPTGGTPHTGNGGDMQDYTAQTGTARSPAGNTGGNWAAYACGNCHGTTVFGGIHGASEVLPDGGKGGGIATNCSTTPSACRNAYRFTNGASMRFYDPAGWNTSSATCYTISSGESGWAGCTKHSGGGGRSKALVRPLSY